jgi:ADP-heptose:LPS heptosyltransferase
VHPGAKWPPKRWPAERFRLLLSRLRTAGLGVVCIGTSQDGPLLRQVTEGVVPAPASLAGELPLGAVAALIQRARIYIGNDSGPMHIACAVGTPAVGLFGPTLPDRTGPLGNSGRGIVRPIDCRPCRMYFTRDGCERGHNYCMDLIQVDDVWAAVTSMCRAGRGRAPIPEPRA